MIYEPSDDSFLLAKYVKKYARGKVLDMGTGSGIQAEVAMENKNVKDVLAVDINPEAVEFVNKKGIKAKISNLFSNVEEKFDTIIFNPPYLPLEKGEDKETSINVCGGKIGNELIKKFLKKAKKHLKKNGIIIIVFSSLSGNIQKLFEKYGFDAELLEEKKLFFEKIFVYKLQQKI